MKKVGQLFRESLVDIIKKEAEANSSVFLMTYSLISSTQMSDLRKDLKSAGANIFVSRNSISKIALKGIKQEELADRIEGQTAFVWGNSDSVEISKILVNFSKDLEQVVIQGGLLDGKVIAQEDVKKLSDLPSRGVLLATLLGTIQSPVTRLLGAFNAKSRDLLSILKQYSEQKGGNENG